MWRGVGWGNKTYIPRYFPGGPVVKNPPYDVVDAGSIAGLATKPAHQNY